MTTYLIITLAQAALIALILWIAYKERKELTDKIMALSNPQALTQVQSTRGKYEGTVGYVDEEPGTKMTRRSLETEAH